MPAEEMGQVLDRGAAGVRGLQRVVSCGALAISPVKDCSARMEAL